MNELRRINTTVICRVVRYSGGVGDLEPLFLDDSVNPPQPFPMIQGARALKQKFNGADYEPEYSSGDIVAVAITQRSFDDAIRGRKGNGNSTSHHDITDAIILGVVT